ncbi:MAG: peptidase S24, partial [Alphaproteobacteria bacterium]|nr:peptidase S24 [Alphaproteobacteria bacterium]
MIVDKIRETLEALIRERGEDYASISLRLGRNPAYIQQFLKRGTPRKLAEDDRRLLARYFDVEEMLLGGPAGRGESSERSAPDGLIAIPLLDVRAAAGAGGVLDDDALLARVGFDAGWLRGQRLRADMLSVISVQGDSMEPTLAAGDDILVDRSDGAARLRDGIYVLR